MSEKKAWVRIDLNVGSSYLVEPEQLGVLYDAELEPAIGDCDWDVSWTITLERLTQEEFDALPEFDGH